MIQPDERVVEALAMLENNSHFKEVMRWIEQSRNEVVEQLVASNDQIHTSRCQGGYRELNEITERARDARELMNKMR